MRLKVAVDPVAEHGRFHASMPRPRQRSHPFIQCSASGCDLALGFFPNLERPALYAQTLFMHTLVCLVRANHPEVKSSRISMKKFLQMSHAVVTPLGRSGELFETMLKKEGLQRRVQLSSVHFLTVPAIIAATDMIVTVPRSIADYYTRLENLRMVEPPLNIKPYAVKQFWHPRFNADPAIRWLRESVVRLFGTRGNAVRPAKKAP